MENGKEPVGCKERSDRLARAYQAVTASLIAGLLRLSQTRIVYNTTKIVLLRFHGASPPISIDNVDPRLADVVDDLKRVRYSDFDSYRYVTDCSLLVYATALFDSFLSGTSAFLLTLHPKALGDSCPLTVQELLSATSKYDVVNQAVRRRTRSLSFGTFLERLKFLNKTFGLGITLDADKHRGLEYCSSLRNAIVHDQTSFVVDLDDQGEIRVRQDNCFRHPTPVGSDELESALKVYGAVCQRTYLAVMTKVIKAEPGVLDKGLSAFLCLPESPQMNLPLPLPEGRGQPLSREGEGRTVLTDLSDSLSEAGAGLHERVPNEVQTAEDG